VESIGLESVKIVVLRRSNTIKFLVQGSEFSFPAFILNIFRMKAGGCL